jgi:hypothetical protein
VKPLETNNNFVRQSEPAQQSEPTWFARPAGSYEQAVHIILSQFQVTPRRDASEAGLIMYDRKIRVHNNDFMTFGCHFRVLSGVRINL